MFPPVQRAECVPGPFLPTGLSLTGDIPQARAYAIRCLPAQIQRCNKQIRADQIP